MFGKQYDRIRLDVHAGEVALLFTVVSNTDFGTGERAGNRLGRLSLIGR